MRSPPTDSTPPRWTTIAADAGISKPMLYNYFGSKQGLYLAFVERDGRELHGEHAAGGIARSACRLNDSSRGSSRS